MTPLLLDAKQSGAWCSTSRRAIHAPPGDVNACPVRDKRWATEGSTRAAVTLHCLQCVGYLRSEVTACTSIRCPLWAFRPYQDKNEPDFSAESEGEPDLD
jgi:hypothetical protein